MKDSLRNISFNKFKTNPTSYLAVGIMCGLFLLLVGILAFIDPAILVIAVPLLALPFLFASHVACYYLQINQQISLTAYARYFVGFFRSQFRGSFRGLISLLKSLGFYFGTLIVAGELTPFPACRHRLMVPELCARPLALRRIHRAAGLNSPMKSSSLY